jgi:ribosomal protein L16/L10AE
VASPRAGFASASDASLSSAELQIFLRKGQYRIGSGKGKVRRALLELNDNDALLEACVVEDAAPFKIAVLPAFQYSSTVRTVKQRVDSTL